MHFSKTYDDGVSVWCTIQPGEPPANWSLTSYGTVRNVTRSGPNGELLSIEQDPNISDDDLRCAIEDELEPDVNVSRTLLYEIRGQLIYVHLTEIIEVVAWGRGGGVHSYL